MLNIRYQGMVPLFFFLSCLCFVRPSIGSMDAAGKPPEDDSIELDLADAVMREALAADLPGDFDDDGRLTAIDINELTQQILHSDYDSRFDVNVDGSLSQLDRLVWVQDLRITWFGDANLDGLFDSSDLVQVFVAGQYEDAVAQNSLWETGDWDGDGEFRSNDLVMAFQDGGYDHGPRATDPLIHAPEPSGLLIGLVLIALGSLSVLPWRMWTERIERHNCKRPR
jgi:hypothetical protein